MCKKLHQSEFFAGVWLATAKHSLVHPLQSLDRYSESLRNLRQSIALGNDVVGLLTQVVVGLLLDVDDVALSYLSATLYVVEAAQTTRTDTQCVR